MNTRALAARTLAPVIGGKASLSVGFERIISQIDQQDKAFFQELCFGALRVFHQLDKLASLLIDKPLRAKDKDVYAIIILGLYQMRELRVPDHAAISECVDAAKKIKKPWATKLINGVLRQYQRRKAELESSFVDDLSFLWSHPSWFIEKIQQAWPDHWENILRANNSRPPLTIRINPLKTDLSTYRKCLQKENLDFIETENSHHGIQLLTPVAVKDLPGYASGLFSVQDEGAQIAANLLSLAPGSRVLDACCAPGGKAAHIIESDPHIGELVCIDIDESRLQRVRDNFSRLNHQANLKLGDASDPQTWWDGRPFDGILLDVPCSATGVIRRHPDIKLLKQASDLVALAELQTRILNAIWQTLTPGGILVYATCSVLPQENEEVVNAFLNERDDALHDTISAKWGIERSVGRQLLPHINCHDGFYYARLIKKH